MKRSPLIAALLTTLVGVALGAGSENFTGEFADKKFMNGQAVLQLSLEQTGNKVTIFFSGVRNDGQGAAPEINATGTVSGGAVQFKFEDDLKNAGTGTITKSGEDVLVSIKATKVVDPRCMQFYGQNMRLKRVRK
jgi:hypothetical protein